jgi:hypothetical protein
MRMKLFEDLASQTEVNLLRSYQLGQGFMVKFNIKKSVAGTSGSSTPVYGYDLYDFEDHFFQSSSGFTTLEEAKWAALAANSADQRKAA